MIVRLFILTMFSFLLTGCYQVGLYLANFSNTDEQHNIYRNLPYGSESWQKLDVYVPKELPAKPAPVVVFFYGGGWSSGDKASYAFVASTLAEHGFITVIPDYVKYPHATYPAYQKDAALATRWITEHIAEYQGDTDKLHLMGHSAGAHIGAMLIADARFLEAVNLNPSVYQSFVGLAGPYAFVPKEKKYKAIFGPPEHYPDMQVPNFIDGDEPPMLLLHGSDDDIVGQFNQRKLTDAVLAKQGDVKTALIEGLGHIRIIGQFSATFDNNNEVVRQSVAFMKTEQGQ